MGSGCSTEAAALLLNCVIVAWREPLKMSRSATNGASSISMPLMMPVKVPLAAMTCLNCVGASVAQE